MSFLQILKNTNINKYIYTNKYIKKIRQNIELIQNLLTGQVKRINSQNIIVESEQKMPLIIPHTKTILYSKKYNMMINSLKTSKLKINDEYHYYSAEFKNNLDNSIFLNFKTFYRNIKKITSYKNIIILKKKNKFFKGRLFTRKKGGFKFGYGGLLTFMPYSLFIKKYKRKRIKKKFKNKKIPLNKIQDYLELNYEIPLKVLSTNFSLFNVVVSKKRKKKNFKKRKNNKFTKKKIIKKFDKFKSTNKFYKKNQKKKI